MASTYIGPIKRIDTASSASHDLTTRDKLPRSGTYFWLPGRSEYRMAKWPSRTRRERLHQNRTIWHGTS